MSKSDSLFLMSYDDTNSTSYRDNIMKALILSILCGMFLTGCAGINFETKRFVKDNTFSSSQFPSLTVSVDDNLRFSSEESSGYEGGNKGATKSTSIKSGKYRFLSRDMQRGLSIIVETLSENNWHMVVPDYSKMKYPITTGKETLAGVEFYTGVFVESKDDYSILIKAYAKTSGDRVRFKIGYFEYVGDEWLTKPALFSSQQRDYLSAFIRRADECFTIGKYQEQLTPALTNPPTTPTVDRKAAVMSTKERFQNIQEIYQSGLMTEEEYQAKRKEIMTEL